jgi:hypothetical protein
MDINFPIKYIILFLAVCLVAVFTYPYLFSPETNETVKPTTEVLATTDYGNVTREGPYGNASSPVKVAYIVGVHPLEHVSHEDAVKAVKKLDKSLRYCYYIYQVNVTGGVNAGYETGRVNGQLLALRHVVPDILENNYQLALDIHSNKGRDDYYAVSWFLFVPYNDSHTNIIAQELRDKIPGIGDYDPPIASSPEYVTVPLIRNGTPAILYEAYEYDSPEIGQDQAEKLLRAIDGTDLTSG